MTDKISNNEAQLLSKREAEALELLVEGLTNQQIALRMGVTDKTVEKHIRSIYHKIHVGSRIEAVLWTIRKKDESRDNTQATSAVGRDILQSDQHKIMLGLRVERRIIMKKLDWIISITAGILLGIIAIGMGVPGMLSRVQPAVASSKVDEILTLVLNSHIKWSTAQGQATITWYDPNGGNKTQTYVSQFVIYQPLSARVDNINRDNSGFNDQEWWISDGMKVYDLDKSTKTYTEGTLPKFASDLSKIPRTISDVQSDTVYEHPFSLLIPAPVKEYIYPEWFAQGNPTTSYSLQGEDSLLGRNAWIIGLIDKTSQSTAWIDKSTGIILKYLHQENGLKKVEMTFDSLELDASVDSSVFSVPKDYRNSGQP